jgi:hypothetical protein
MKIKFQIKMVILAAALTASTARSQDVITNFNSQTPNWRIINGQTYDLLSFPSIQVPPELSYVTYGYNGVPKQPIILQGFLQGNPAKSVTFRNFPFDPKDFSPVHGVTGLQPNHSLYCRALKTSEVTNWNVLGQQISVDTVYDCGAP